MIKIFVMYFFLLFSICKFKMLIKQRLLVCYNFASKTSMIRKMSNIADSSIRAKKQNCSRRKFLQSGQKFEIQAAKWGRKEFPSAVFRKNFKRKSCTLFFKSLVCCASDGLEHLTVIYRTFYYPYLVLATSIFTRFTRSSSLGQPGDRMGMKQDFSRVIHI